jgi:hypothetical protein
MGVRQGFGGRMRRKVVGSRTPRAPYAPPRNLTDFLHDLVTDPEVQEAVKDHIVSGEEGAVQLFFEAVAHVIGRPRQTVRVEVTPELARLLSLAHQFRADQKQGEHATDEGSAALPPVGGRDGSPSRTPEHEAA